MKTITDKASLSQFLEDVEQLQDALLHEAILIHPGYIAGNRDMFGHGELPDAILIFQSQFQNVAAVQLKLKQVSVFNLDFSRDFEFQGEFSKDGIVLYPAGKEWAASTKIQASAAEYSILDANFLGSQYRFINQGSS